MNQKNVSKSYQKFAYNNKYFIKLFKECLISRQK